MLRTSLFSWLIFSSITTVAQWQAGISAGIANYAGDLADQVYMPKLTRPAAGLHLKYEVLNRVILRAGITHASVAGADKHVRNVNVRSRNLSFRSRITEISLTAEVHTFRLDAKRWSPYMFGGVAIFHFNPFTFNGNGAKVFLKPLSTEGQGLPGYITPVYSLTQWAIPIGGGIRYNISDRITLGGEIGLRTLFTDHLDDVSSAYAAESDLLQYRGQQAVDLAYRTDELPGGNPAFPQKGTGRGSARYNDFYYLFTISLSFRLGDGDRGRSSSKRSGYGCPARF